MLLCNAAADLFARGAAQHLKGAWCRVEGKEVYPWLGGPHGDASPADVACAALALANALRDRGQYAPMGLSVMGALCFAAGEPPDHPQIQSALRLVAQVSGRPRVEVWNDDLTTSVTDVITALRAAAALEKE